MRKLASIQKVLDLRPIKGADRIEVAQIMGWECVVKKGEFKVGDTIVYIEVDSKVPEKECFEFLRDRKFRVRTIKLKKQISQGLVLGLDILPLGKYKEGDDVSDILGVVKFDPQAEKESRLAEEQFRNKNKVFRYMCRYKWFRKLFVKGKTSSFPSFISKTDETRIQNSPKILSTYKDLEFQVTEKIDGQSGTYALKRCVEKKMFGLIKKEVFEFIVCSRNLHLTVENNSSYWEIARKFKIKDALKNLIGEEDYIILQGEITGEGIQSNRYKVEGYDFHAFNLTYPNGKVENFEAMARLNQHGIKFVPILDCDFKLLDNVADMVEYSKGNSVITSEVIREGVVIRNYEKNVSFKVINPDWLLKFED